MVFQGAICFYCKTNNYLELGLDRIDNSLGHSLDNVVTCCSKCNNILGDLPNLAKLELISGLTAIRSKGLLDNWEIPTQRHLKAKEREINDAAA
jgi:5-methylcytosine-specific restriction endonuclease McrA